jgi:hypothetical protein
MYGIIITQGELTQFIMGKFSKGVLRVSSGNEDVILKQPKYTMVFPIPPFDKPYEKLTPMNNVGITYSYTIT